MSFTDVERLHSTNWSISSANLRSLVSGFLMQGEPCSKIDP